MPCLVTVAVGDSAILIRCDQLVQDPILPANVQLVRCSELTVEGVDGTPWATDVWSIPARQVISYAYGQAWVAPQPEPEPVTEAEPVPELTPEQQARAARRRAELREADRMLLEMARAKLDAADPSPAAEDPTAEKPTPATTEKPARTAKRPARGRKQGR